MLKKLFSYYKQNVGLLILDIVCVIFKSASDILFPLITRIIIQGQVSIVNELIILLIGLLVIYSVKYLCNYIIGYQGHILGINIENTMRADLFKKFQLMDYQYFDDKKSGELLTNLTTHLFDLSEASHHCVEDIVYIVLVFIGSSIACFIVNPLLSAIVYTGIIGLMFFLIFRRRKMMKRFREVRTEQGNIASEINSSLNGIQLTKAFNNEEFQIKNFDVINNKYKTARKKQIYEIAIFHSTANYLINITNLILLLAGGLMFIYHKISSGDLVMFFLYVNFLITPITTLANTIETASQAWSGFERFYKIMITNNTIIDKIDPIVKDKIKGNISFKNVSFRYKKENEEVLSNFSLDIKAGSKVALVGETGVGKSTIAKIIPRFYEVNNGEILIDNINIKDYKLDNLRSFIGHVQQDVFIFYGSIKDNIKFGNPNASDEEIIEAAKKANIDEFINSLPDGYNTMCGERGIQLSGGQKQRISIARIFLKSPSILILDEATSALDNVTEKLIQKSFDELSKDKTTILIAHRLTTVENADNIVVIGKNGIIEQGTHLELMNKKGVYYSMYNASNE